MIPEITELRKNKYIYKFKGKFIICIFPDKYREFTI